jgi:hypothetical protein
MRVRENQHSTATTVEARRRIDGKVSTLMGFPTSCGCLYDDEGVR